MAYAAKQGGPAAAPDSTDLTTARLALNIMKTSPDPLQPMQNWQELWNFGPSPAELPSQTRANRDQHHSKKPRQQAFSWLTHLIDRDSEN
jgi:hypothetical protein